jgi:hypothetical protein
MTIRPWNALLLLLLLMAAGCRPSPPETAVDDLLPVARDPASTCGLARPPEEQARLQPASFYVQALELSLPESSEQPGPFDPPLALPASEFVRIDTIESNATVKMPTTGLQELAGAALGTTTRITGSLALKIRERGGQVSVFSIPQCRDCSHPISIQTEITVCPDFAYEITSVATYKGRQTRMEFVRSNDGLTSSAGDIRPYSILFNSLHADLQTIGVNLCTSVNGNPCKTRE